MGKRVSEMTQEQIIAQRERTLLNKHIKRMERVKFDILATEAEINKMNLSPVHRAYLKLGVLMEISRY